MTWVHYASIPPETVKEWLKRGVDIDNPDHKEMVRNLMNNEYAHLRDSEYKRETAAS